MFVIYNMYLTLLSVCFLLFILFGYGDASLLDSPMGGCVYNGTTYQQGDTWTDGCKYDCLCVSAQRGYYRCLTRCPVWRTVPQGCVLETPAGKCCQKPRCNGVFVGDDQGNLNMCLYKGEYHREGATWQDGCSYNCTCVSGQTGRYKCDSLCPVFSTIPPECYLKTTEGECCAKLACTYDGMTVIKSEYSTADKDAFTANVREKLETTVGLSSGGSAGTSSSAMHSTGPIPSAVLRALGQAPSTSNSVTITGIIVDDQPDIQMDSLMRHEMNGRIRADNINAGRKQMVGGANTGMTGVKPEGTVSTDMENSVAGTGTVHSGGNVGFIDASGQLTVAQPIGFCTYNGQKYEQGAVWQDGCKYSCQCVDADIGYYVCKSRCQTWTSLPTGCSLQPQHGECCEKPVCGGIVVETGPGGTINICRYGETYYKEGDIWMDACKYNCSCVDGSKGYWECRSVCPTYTRLPSFCKLQPQPGECCPNLVCEGHGTFYSVYTTYGWRFTRTRGQRETAVGLAEVNIPGLELDLNERPITGTNEYSITTTGLGTESVQSSITISGSNIGVQTTTDVGGMSANNLQSGGNLGKTCQYKGQTYREGEHWKDGCKYNCMCRDGNRGYWECRSMCPTFTLLPSFCKLQTQSGDCCPYLVCEGHGTFYSIYTTYGWRLTRTRGQRETADGLSEVNIPGLELDQNESPITGTNEYSITTTGLGTENVPSPITISGSNIGVQTTTDVGAMSANNLQSGGNLMKTCQYQGQTYREGEHWKDGCKYNCMCRDGNRGYWECRSMCPTFTLLPSFCKLQPQSGECCPYLVCEGHGTFYSIYTTNGWRITQTKGQLQTVDGAPGITIPGLEINQSEPMVTGLNTNAENKKTIDTGSLPGSLTIGGSSISVLKLDTIGPKSKNDIQTDGNFLNTCQYQGQTYRDGEQWKDSCQYSCMCVDGTRGYWECRSMCPTYTRLPSFCKLQSQQEECCPDLVCEGHGTFYSIFTSYGWRLTRTRGHFDTVDGTTEINIPGLEIDQNEKPITDTNAYSVAKTMPGTESVPGPQTVDNTGRMSMNTLQTGGNLMKTCQYQGQTYREGEHWKEGCKYNCQCVDGTRGYWECRSVCPTYTMLPIFCDLHPEPDECCPSIVCDGYGTYYSIYTTNGWRITRTRGQPQTHTVTIPGLEMDTNIELVTASNSTRITSTDTGSNAMVDQEKIGVPYTHPKPLDFQLFSTGILDKSDIPGHGNMADSRPNSLKQDSVTLTGTNTSSSGSVNTVNIATNVGNAVLAKLKQKSPNEVTIVYNAETGAETLPSGQASKDFITPLTNIHTGDISVGSERVGSGLAVSPGEGVTKYKDEPSAIHGKSDVGVVDSNSVTNTGIKDSRSVKENRSLAWDDISLKELSGYMLASGMLNSCTYNGIHYKQGQTWQDGCKYTCKCLDAPIGYYMCTDPCPTWSKVPANCNMKTVSGECCQIPFCDGTFLTVQEATSRGFVVSNPPFDMPSCNVQNIEVRPIVKSTFAVGTKDVNLGISKIPPNSDQKQAVVLSSVDTLQVDTTSVVSQVPSNIMPSPINLHSAATFSVPPDAVTLSENVKPMVKPASEQILTEVMSFPGPGKSGVIPLPEQGQTDMVPSLAQGQSDIMLPSAEGQPNVMLPSAEGLFDAIRQSATGQFDVIPPSAQEQYDAIPPSAQEQFDPIPPSAQGQSNVMPPLAQGQLDAIPPSAQEQSDSMLYSAQKQFNVIPSQEKVKTDVIPSPGQMQSESIPSAEPVHVAFKPSSGQMLPGGIPSPEPVHSVTMPSSGQMLSDGIPSPEPIHSVNMPSSGQGVPATVVSPEPVQSNVMSSSAQGQSNGMSPLRHGQSDSIPSPEQPDVMPFSGECYYKGITYQQGDKWQDGCDYSCECINANSGEYYCESRCPTWINLPPTCHLETPTGECCQQPVCDGVQLTTGQAQARGITMTSLQGGVGEAVAVATGLALPDVSKFSTSSDAQANANDHIGVGTTFSSASMADIQTGRELIPTGELPYAIQNTSSIKGSQVTVPNQVTGSEVTIDRQPQIEGLKPTMLGDILQSLTSKARLFDSQSSVEPIGPNSANMPSSNNSDVLHSPSMTTRDHRSESITIVGPRETGGASRILLGTQPSQSVLSKIGSVDETGRIINGNQEYIVMGGGHQGQIDAKRQGISGMIHFDTGSSGQLSGGRVNMVDKQFLGLTAGANTRRRELIQTVELPYATKNTSSEKGSQITVPNRVTGSEVTVDGQPQIEGLRPTMLGDILQSLTSKARLFDSQSGVEQIGQDPVNMPSSNISAVLHSPSMTTGDHRSESITIVGPRETGGASRILFGTQPSQSVLSRIGSVDGNGRIINGNQEYIVMGSGHQGQIDAKRQGISGMIQFDTSSSGQLSGGRVNIVDKPFLGLTAGANMGMTGCVYNGTLYGEGSSWQDGCKYNCTCVDAQRGQYNCYALCLTYTAIPGGCKLVVPSGECCEELVCDTTIMNIDSVNNSMFIGQPSAKVIELGQAADLTGGDYTGVGDNVIAKHGMGGGVEQKGSRSRVVSVIQGMSEGGISTGRLTGGLANSGVSGGMATGAVMGDMFSSDVLGGKVTEDISGSVATGDVAGVMATGGVSGGMAIGGVSGGIVTGGVLGGMAAGDLSGGMATGDLSGGMATGGVFGGMATDDISGGMATGDQSGGVATGDQSGGMATGNQSSGMATGGVLGGMATGDLSGGMATGVVLGGMATDDISGGMATGDQSGGMATGDQSGGMATGDQSSGMATGDQSSGMATGDLSGEMATGVLSGGMATGDLPDKMATGGVPGGMATVDVSGGMATGDIIGDMTYESVLGGMVTGGMSSGMATGGVSGDMITGGILGGTAHGGVSGGMATDVVSRGMANGDFSGGMATTYISDGIATGGASGGMATGGASGGMATGDLSGGMATTYIADGIATGGVTGGMVTGGVSGGIAAGGVSGDMITGGILGGMTHGGLSGGMAAGGVSGVMATGGVSGGMATGGVSGGMATGGVSGGMATGGVSGGMATGGVSGGMATGGVSGGMATGGVLDGMATGGVSGGMATGGVLDGMATGGVSGVMATGGVSGGMATGGVSGGMATGGVLDGMATGGVSGGMAAGGVLDGMATGGVAGGMATGGVSGDMITRGILGGMTHGGLSGRIATVEVSGGMATGDLSGGMTAGGVLGGMAYRRVPGGIVSASVSGRMATGGVSGGKNGTGSYRGGIITLSGKHGVNDGQYMMEKEGGMLGSAIWNALKSKVCRHKGKQYQQGESWKDGCDFHCECVDANKGYYRCRALCLNWSLPPVCTLDPPPAGKCCQVPNCPEYVQLNYPPNFVHN